LAQYKSDLLAVNFLGVRGEMSACCRSGVRSDNWEIGLTLFLQVKGFYQASLARRHKQNLQVRCFYGIAAALGSEPEN
jgi:hypothetical protein